MTKGDKELALVFGGAGVLLLAYLFWPKGTSVVNPPAPTPTAPPLLQNTALPQSTDVTVVPNGNLSISVDVGTIIIVWLPLGGKWVSVDGAPITNPVLPDTFVFQGPISHSYVWTDQNNRTQTCTLNFTIGVSTPIVTT